MLTLRIWDKIKIISAVSRHSSERRLALSNFKIIKNSELYSFNKSEHIVLVLCGRHQEIMSLEQCEQIRTGFPFG